MNNTIIFDIETCSLPLDKLTPPEFTPNRTLKDPDKIKADLDAKRKEWEDKLALDATTGRVAMIGTLDEVSPNLFGEEWPEKQFLPDFWDCIDHHLGKGVRVIGFNCFAFDLPFLVRRSWVHGIKIPAIVRKGRYWNDGIIDLMEVWSCGKREQTISLNNLCRFLGVGEKSGNGADFGKLTKEQQVEYLTHDLKLTAACAARLLPED